MAILALLAAVILIPTMIYLVQSLYIRLRYKLPPGPRPLPIVGNMYDLKPIKFRCYAEWARTYGPIFSVYLDSKLNVIVNTSELAKEVLKENDQQLADRHRNRATMSFSRGGKDLIWADYGPHYVKVRKVCNLELFSPKRLEALRPIREDEVTAMVESIFKDSVDPGMVSLFCVFYNFVLCLYLCYYLWINQTCLDVQVDMHIVYQCIA